MFYYLALAAILFSIGMFGVLTRRNTIGILMSLELMFNAVNINFVAFNKFILTDGLIGQMFAIFIIVVAAAEAVVALNHLQLDDKKFVDLCGEGEWFVGTRGGHADHVNRYGYL